MNNTEEIIAARINKYEEIYEKRDHEFLLRIFGDDIIKYEQRLRQYGFVGLKNVLDAGCGYGQWSLALAKLNQYVYAVDSAPIRIMFLKDILKEIGTVNVSTLRCNVEHLRFPDKTFDAIFSYCVLHTTEWKKVVKEYYRVLEPGGIMYVTANATGWYSFLWDTKHNQTEGYDPQLLVARAYYNTWCYKNGHPINSGDNIIIEPEELKSFLNEIGFSVIDMRQEGKINVTGEDVELLPFMKGDYKGEYAVFEALAEKK